MSHLLLNRESWKLPMPHRRSWSSLAPIAPLVALIAAVAGCPETREESRSMAAGNAAVAQNEPKRPSPNVMPVTSNKSSEESDATHRNNELEASNTQGSTIDNKSGSVNGSPPIVDRTVAQTSGTTKDQALNSDSGVKTAVHADARNDDGTYGKSHVDPVKLNGPIFVDWPKPKLALLFSGAQQGYIEPCGCAGLENQKGGLSRRHQLMKKLRSDGWPVAAFEAGGLVKKFGRQQELKFAASIEGLKAMEYDAIAFGGDDLPLRPMS